jgi:hypothetical protein
MRPPWPILCRRHNVAPALESPATLEADRRASNGQQSPARNVKLHIAVSNGRRSELMAIVAGSSV